MKTYSKCCRELLILRYCKTSEKSTSRSRNRWKPIQNAVANYSFWGIVKHPKNRRLAVAIDENLFKMLSRITHFEVFGSEPHFEVPRFISKRSKTNKINVNPKVYFSQLRAPGNSSAKIYIVKSTQILVFIFFRNLKLRLRLVYMHGTRKPRRKIATF